MTQTSREYAEALFELALTDHNVEETAEALALVERELAENPDYGALLASPALSREERKASLQTVFGDRVPRTVLALLQMMVSRGHARQMDAMIQAWRALAREHRGESIARVTSAVPLTEEQQQALQARLNQMFSRKMILQCEVDPALIGGIRVEAEGRVMDGSLRGRLKQIKEVMNA